MSEMDKYYQILGLNPGASEEEIKQAYRDLVNVWHPDRFPNNPRLREKANEKLKEINFAYKMLKSYIAGKGEEYTASEEMRTHAKSQPPPHEPPPRREEEQSSTTESGGYEESKPSPNEPPPGFSQHFTKKSPAPWIPLTLFFGALGMIIGINLSNYLIGFLVGCLIGLGAGRFINEMDGTRKYKVGIAWGAAIAGFFLYVMYVMIPGSTTSENYTPTSSTPSSSPNGRQSSNPSPQTSEATAVDWYNKGHSFLSSGNYRDAVNAFSRAIDLNLQFAEAYVCRGVAYDKLGDSEPAITDWSKAIELNPKGAIAYHNRGWAFFRKRHHDDALGDFNKALSINPNYYGAYLGRGWAFLRKFQYDEALQDFNKAISLKPDNVEGYNGRGFTEYKKGQYDNAIEDSNKAIRINANHPAIYSNRGYTYLELGKNQLAVTDFQKSIELKEKNIRDCYIGLSIACFRQNKIEDAKANYQKAIEIEPLCKNGLDAVEKRDNFSYTPGNKQTVNEIVKLIQKN